MYHVVQDDLPGIKSGGCNLAIPIGGTLPPTWPTPHPGRGYVENCGQLGLKSFGLGGERPDLLQHYKGSPDLLCWYVAD